MSDISSLKIQMNEFQMATQLINSQLRSLNSLAEEIIADYENGKQSLEEALAGEPELGRNFDAKNYKEEMKNNFLTECGNIEAKLKGLVSIESECKQFEAFELKIRDKFTKNTDEFKDGKMDQLFEFKATQNDLSEHEQLLKFKSIVDKLEGGAAENDGEDLVVDSAPTQVAKCPITGKVIEDAFKNSCGHTYEREAVIAYCRGKPNKKCPYAGCQSYVNISLLRQR